MGDYRQQMKVWLESNRPFSVGEIRAAGIPSQILADFRRQGKIERLSRGVYLPSNSESTENLSLQIAALKVPNGVVCLLSALRFHNFTTQLPHEIWLTVKQHSRIPRLESPELRITTMTEGAFQFGIEEHDLDGIKVKVYSAAKTVADCFKFRNKIGLDTVMEAVRFYRERKSINIDNLMYFADICRVKKVIQPYLEAIFQ